jgi:predicted Zn-dependent protease
MESQACGSAAVEFERARGELAAGNVLTALAGLEKALGARDEPGWYSFLGYCVARERGHVGRGLELCRAAIEHDPGNPLHYLNLSKVHLVAKQKAEALQVLRQGKALGGSPEIDRLLMELGTRRPPVLPFLSRGNPLNKYLGIMLGRLGLR